MCSCVTHEHMTSDPHMSFICSHFLVSGILVGMKIVVRMPNWIGDFVMATPLLEDLKRLYPDAQIAALCTGVLGELLENNPYVDEVIVFSRKNRLFPKLLKEKYDLGILLTNSLSSAWHFFLSPVKKRVGFAKNFRRFLVTDNIPFPKNKKKQHLVLTYKALIGSNSHSEPKLFIAPKEKKIGRTTFGINPGAAYGSAKCWPPERFTALIQRLLDEVPNCEIKLFGDKLTKSLVDAICDGFDSRVINLAGKTTLRELIQEIGALDAFLTNDSGPMHMAASLKVPLVALFGSTNPYATGPYKRGKIIYKAVSCSPCYKRVCPIDFRCMKQIEVDEVVKEMKRALLTEALAQKYVPLSFENAKEPKITTDATSSEKKIGVIIMAAGMGRRLGFSGPKGCFEINGKSLYEILLEKITGRCAIMTSPATHKETKAFLEKKGYRHIDLFQERCLPRLTEPFEESPEGNGALFSTFFGSPLWDKWKDIDEICVLPIDNPLAEVLPLGESDLAVLAIEKTTPDENIGALLDKEGKLHCAEYFEIPENQKERWKLGYSGIFSCSKSFFETAAKAQLPWHQVTRHGKKHFEKFAFDAFSLANTYKIILKSRKTVFAPIKTKEDVVYYTENVR